MPVCVFVFLKESNLFVRFNVKYLQDEDCYLWEIGTSCLNGIACTLWRVHFKVSGFINLSRVKILQKNDVIKKNQYSCKVVVCKEVFPDEVSCKKCLQKLI